MQEESSTLIVSKDISPSSKPVSDPHILRTYSFGRRVRKNSVAASEKNNSRTRMKSESISCVKSEPSGSGAASKMPSPAKVKQVNESEGERAKSTLKRKVDMSEAAILRSVLRPQNVPVPVDKVGLIREPQVIVRKFNIPVLCPNNSTKFGKLKERWKYQHDVVGMTNVNPTNPLHSIMKSKPVVSLSVASFVNDCLTTGITTSPATKVSTSSARTILPKNHIVATNAVPVSPIGVIPGSLPSTPTAVVRPVQMLPTPLTNVGPLEAGKYVILKAVDIKGGVSDVVSESEVVTTTNLGLPKVLPQVITKDVQNGKVYLNPFAEVGETTEAVEEMDTDEPDSPEDIASDANTLHLEILSECGTRTIKCALTGNGDIVTNVSGQGETMISMPSTSESDLSNQTKTFSIPHPDKPVTVITVPVSSSAAVPQMFLKPQAVGTPTNPIQQSNVSRTFQVSPTALLNGPTSDNVKKVFLKPVKSQPTSVSPSKLPLIVTGKADSDKVFVKSVKSQSSADNWKQTNLNLLTARQSFALQYQRDLIKEQEEVQIPRAVSFPARNAELMDRACQTHLFSLLEAGRFVEMSFSHDPKEMRVSGSTIPVPAVQVMNLKNSSKSPQAPSVEPANKRMKLDQGETSTSNLFKMLCSSACEKKLQLNGVEAMVVDPNEVLPEKNMKSKPAVVSRETLIRTAYMDWKASLVPDEEGNLPIHKAVLDENLTLVKRQCYVLQARRHTIDVRNAERQTPLHLAVWLGCPQIVKALLEFGSRPELVDQDGNNALHLAIEETSNLECLEILLQVEHCRKFIDCLNYEGYSPLHRSVLAGKCAEAIALVKHDADINLRDGKSGRTALFHSVEARDSNMSRLLVQYGASASVTNFAGQTPLLATNDMSMLGDNAMASVIMSRNMLPKVRQRQNSDDSWKMFEDEDR